jgi:hypothetical protein
MDAYGKLCEDTLNDFVVKRYGVRHDTYKYATFDWKPHLENNQVELKARSCKYEDYEHLTANDIKIKEAKRLYGGIDSYFIYWFSNGDIYEWKYDPLVILPRLINGDPTRVGHIKERPHIPRRLLTKIGNLPQPTGGKPPNPLCGKCLLL